MSTIINVINMSFFIFLFDNGNCVLEPILIIIYAKIDVIILLKANNSLEYIFI
jgi:hypothetical protein